MKEATHYERLPGNKVRCLLCPHHCLMTDGKSGICLTRRNQGGILVSLNYCRPVSSAIDPIEKKPLYHFRPGSLIFSTGPNGCTMKCVFCQNCEISQRIIPTREVPAHELVREVQSSGTIGIAYTYSEPYIWFETIMEVGRLVREAGLVNVMVSNGFMEPGPADELLSIVDAMNIDIKSIRPAFYRRLCKTRLEPVLRTCEHVKKRCHLEITNLLIPGENDSEDEIRELSSWIAANLGRDTPLHLSRYFPRYRMNTPSTPVSTLTRAWEIAQESLDYVYAGNFDAGDKANTYCTSCGGLVVRRSGYVTEVVSSVTMRGENRTYAACATCHAPTNIIVGS